MLVSGPDPYFGAVRRNIAGGCVRARENIEEYRLLVFSTLSHRESVNRRPVMGALGPCASGGCFRELAGFSLGIWPQNFDLKF